MTMMAVVADRYGTPEVLRLEEVTRPTPKADEILVRVRASSINTADIDNLRGRPWIARLGTGLRRPRAKTPGLDIAGVVEDLGPEAARFEVGDAVWADLFSSGFGAFAEYVCVPEAALAPIPDGVDFERAATVPHSAVLALQAIESRGISPGDRVLVNGGGGCVGPFAIQIARSHGAEVTGVDHQGKHQLMRAAGADHLIDFALEDVTRNGRRYDLIVDIAAKRSVLPFKRSLTERGAYVQIANSLGGFFSAAVLGALIGGKRRMGVFMWVPNDSKAIGRIGRLLQSGSLTPLIDRSFPLAETRKAIQHQASGEARGKVVITVGA
jgi:NADPH:quinone reductase-like Zn-dependent oxidoreductase